MDKTEINRVVREIAAIMPRGRHCTWYVHVMVRVLVELSNGWTLSQLHGAEEWDKEMRKLLTDRMLN